MNALPNLTDMFSTRKRGRETIAHLAELITTISQGGDPDKDFWYVGGPMSNIPRHNFPRFDFVSERLRAADYNVISPAELDDPKKRAEYMNSPDGVLPRGEYDGLLGRDLIVVALPTCVGMLCIEGWHNSRGARGESWQAAYLGKPIMEYDDSSGEIVLTLIDRDARLKELGVPDYARGAVPRDKPGLLTAAGELERAH